MTNTINTQYAINQTTMAPIGKIEYHDDIGNVIDYTYYWDVETMLKDAMDELEWGVSISATLFTAENDGNSAYEPLFEDIVDLMYDFAVTEAPKHVTL